MGFTITATNSKYDFSGGMGGFKSLRQNIAKAWDKEFGEHYAQLGTCCCKEDYEWFNQKAKRIFSHERFKAEDKDIVEFLYACDCDGSISHKTCKKIYDIIKDIDFGKQIFTYAYWSDGKDYEKFKEFLLDCYKRRAKMVWY
jgi:hypothetical protein